MERANESFLCISCQHVYCQVGGLAYVRLQTVITKHIITIAESARLVLVHKQTSQPTTTSKAVCT